MKTTRTNWAHEVWNARASQIIDLAVRWNPDLNMSIRDLKQAVTSSVPRGQSPATWQEAFNLATGATPGRPGRLSFQTTISCEQCRGRRVSPRTMQVCHVCMGRGQTRQTVTVQFVHATAPTST